VELYSVAITADGRGVASATQNGYMIWEKLGK
jgi:hypothetical protein